MEIYKDIIGYENHYQVSDFGNVRSLKKGKIILKPQLGRHGYYHVNLSINGKIRTKKIHQLVAIAFHSHTPNGMKSVVNHKNFIRTDNRAVNLEIVTSRENSNLKHLKSSSQFTGVSWYKRSKKWVAMITNEGKNKNLGYFTDEKEAHNAYQNALKQINESNNILAG